MRLPKRVTRSVRIGATVATAVLVLTSCGDSGDSEGGAGGEQTDMKVGVLPLGDYAAVYWAAEKGFFEDAGLDVELTPLAGGPVGIQSSVSGDVDCSFANTIATLVAQDSEVPIEMVALSSALGAGAQPIMVPDDSPIQTVADLDGETVAVNTTNSVGDVALNNLIEADGLGIEVSYVEVPFPEMIDGLQSGSVAAAHMPEPFRSSGLAAGLREVVDLASGPNESLPAAAFVCGQRFVDDNPDTTKAFAEAIYAAGADMTAHEDDLRGWLPGIADIPEDVAASMKLPTYFDKPEPSELSRLADLLADQGLIDDGFDVDSHLYQP